MATAERVTALGDGSRALLRMLLRPVLCSAPVSPVWHRLSGTPPVCLMLHRFRADGAPESGLEVGALRKALTALRRERRPIVSLRHQAARLADGAPLLAGEISITVDDGYVDFAELAAPVFREFDVPVTTFIVADFAEQRLWLWWDRVEHAVLHTSVPVLRIPLPGGEDFRADLRSPDARRRSAADLVRRLERLPENERQAILRRLPDLAQVTTPALPPARWAAMSWQTIRALATDLIEFGAHTVTHPILSTTSAECSSWEIAESVRRLAAHVPQAVPVFCYPNGSAWAFGEREESNVALLGLTAAVATTPAYLHGPAVARLHSLPRFAWPEDPVDLRQITSGFEWIKSRVRG